MYFDWLSAKVFKIKMLQKPVFNVFKVDHFTTVYNLNIIYSFGVIKEFD